MVGEVIGRGGGRRCGKFGVFVVLEWVEPGHVEKSTFTQREGKLDPFRMNKEF